MISAAVDFARAWTERFLAVQGVDRAMALAAQAFSAAIPLLVVSTAIVSRDEQRSYADELVERFDLEGATAASVREAFTTSQTVTDSISAFGLVLLVVSALSFTRGMQRLYESAYELPTLGMRNTLGGLGWLALIAVYASVRPVAAGLFDETIVKIVVSLAIAAAAWLATPYLLLGRRVDWRRLMSVAILTAIGMTALTTTSVIWFPRTIETSADQFGVMGVAFALLSWLVAAGFVLVIAATGGAAVADRMKGRWG